ncbi:pyridoxamine 5'-phosphate oxidase family protein [Arsenicibacter rosenii]|uniref:Pyridoxamine 5'-phosphate oxidase n=1 Tax=Arsenicibacter rosenii TaxID=1750698 RepID=A0A1S2VIM5_9BACT|nr:pyridoxamine 5'-phosphate oxidase family protein [Arsenicibacter rosenii]OIN58066.1 pyridoxamine 5'-phosphate oxidase [Arsenicibacter rosenii]
MDTQQQNNEHLKKVRELIDDIKIGMMTTVGSDGKLLSRPMATMQVDEAGHLWFFTKKHSPKTEQIDNHQQLVNVSYASVSDASYVSVAGHAEEVDDQAKIDELWSPIAKPWFPEGKEDPNLTLLKVEMDTVEYWDSTSSRMVRLVEMARAILTGDTYKEGENEKVVLH